jgi:5'-3' exonuclease
MTPGPELLLVDGTYELYRAYYGAPRKQAPSGLEVGAAIGIGRSLHALSRKNPGAHLAVAFDTVIESFRNDLLTTYKTGEGIEPELFQQFPWAEEIVRALGIKVLSMIDYEADDALASLASAGSKSGRFERVILATPDKDLMQCVEGTTVVTWDRMRQKYYDEAAVHAKLGVAPRSVPDYLALVGDPADGIPGLPRWGAKAASRVLAVYGHLEHIPDQPRDWDEGLISSLRGAAALAEILRERRTDAQLYRTVATLKVDLELVTTWDELRPGPLDRTRLAALASEWASDWLEELSRV